MLPRIFVLPHAGGSSYSYYGLTRLNVDVTLVDYPGHGTRSNQPLLSTLNDIVEELYSFYFKDMPNKPFYLFGHSMGGMIGYLLSLKIFKKTSLLPERLIISGIAPPQNLPVKQLHKLSDYDFMVAMQEYGGLPDSIMGNKEMIDFFLPIIKNDIKSIETFHFTESKLPHIPTALLWGSNDIVDKHTMSRWTHYTGNDTILREIVGNHFSIFENFKVIETIVNPKNMSTH